MRQNIYKISFIILCSLLLTSCASFKNDPGRKLSLLDKNDFTKIEGHYENYPSSIKTRIDRELYELRHRQLTLWSELTGESQFNDSIGTIKDQTVIIKFVSNRKAVAELFYKGEQISSKSLNGKIKHGYFCYRGSFVLIPFFPVLYKRSHQKYRVGLTSDNHLVIDNAWNYWMFAILAGDYNIGQRSLEFSRE
jgi:hypothetical protein